MDERAGVPARAGAVLGRLRRSRAVRWGLPLVLAALAIPLLHHAIPPLDAVVDELHTARPSWLAAAAVAELVSLDMFARQQRRLLRAFDTRMSQSRAVALTFSRTAITYAVPAGSAVSAAFAFGEFRSRGASRSTAATVTLVSGLASTVGLLVVYVLGMLGTAVPAVLSQPWPQRLDGAAGARLAGLCAISIVVCWLFLFARARRARRCRGQTPVAAAGRRDRSGTALRWPPLTKLFAALARARASLVDALRQAGAVPRWHWYAAVALAALNWLTDMLCLMSVAYALHLHVGMVALGSAYLAVQVARQVPLTPGGIGLVEASLLAALISAGAGEATAAAVVLGYRLLSCWLVIPIGMLTWFALRGGPRSGAGAAGTRERSSAQRFTLARRGGTRRSPGSVRAEAVADTGASGSTDARGSYGRRKGFRPRSCIGANRRRATRSV